MVLSGATVASLDGLNYLASSSNFKGRGQQKGSLFPGACRSRCVLKDKLKWQDQKLQREGVQ